MIGRVPPPPTLDALWGRALALEGASVAEVARAHGVTPPADPVRGKGFVGGLVEAALGATAGNRAEPDFPALGVELKTVPVDERGAPREATYVCTAPLDGSAGAAWADAWVRRKLACVLWVPVGAEGGWDERRFGRPVLWRPSAEDDAILAADFRAFADAVALGELWQLRGDRGVALQIRPKAANAAAATWVQDEDGDWVRKNPVGFYLRARFTRTILSRG